MGQATVKRYRVVLDTNVLVSALIFSTRGTAWLRKAWQCKRMTPLASRDTVRELVRVLAYPKFRLTGEEREALLAEYLPFAEIVEVSSSVAGMPRCGDPHDEKFLALALVGKADALVSGDQDLLRLACSFPVPILTPTRFRTLLEAPSGPWGARQRGT